MKRPLIRSQATAIAAGLGLYLAGSYVLWDAFEGRGAKAPLILRPFTWW